jgi:hypothetical protein
MKLKPHQRPIAISLKVEDLLDKLRDGSIRIPKFQRPLKWNAENNKLLFDSIIKGFPMGSLLMWKRKADAEFIRFGNFEVAASSRDDAWWVVDGQQRLTALASLLAQNPDSKSGFAVSLDDESIVSLARAKKGHFVPLHVLVDYERLLPYFQAHPELNREQREHAQQLLKKIKEYQLPVTVLESDHEKYVSDVFSRLNSSGKPLKQTAIFRALQVDGAQSMDDVKRAIERMQFGRIKLTILSSALEAFSAKRKPNTERFLRGAREAVVFLQEMGVRHKNLLSNEVAFGVLAVFFATHGSGDQRNRELLKRWYWRSVSSLPLSISKESVRRMYLAVLVPSESNSVQRLLEESPKKALVPDSDANWKIQVAAFHNRPSLDFSFSNVRTKSDFYQLLRKLPHAVAFGVIPLTTKAFLEDATSDHGDHDRPPISHLLRADDE